MARRFYWWCLLLWWIRSRNAYGFPLLLSDHHAGGGTLLLQQGLVGMATFAALVVNADRPRGGCIIPDCVAVRDSAIAGQGLFATQDMQKGTILGQYPGVVTELTPHLQKLQRFPQCEAYIWRFADGRYVIDPTNRFGTLDDVTYGGNFRTAWIFATGRLLARDTMLCRINEPPLGQTTNVRMTENAQDRTVMVSLVANVQAGDELFTDYGPRYDRSGYGGAKPPPPPEEK
jgi:hypothetical protein